MMMMLATLFAVAMYNNIGAWSSSASKTGDSSLYSSFKAESASSFQMN
jgi:hypothetical protein